MTTSITRWLKGNFLKMLAKTDPHLAGEEKLFYPVLEQKGKLRDLVNHAMKNTIK